MPQVLTAEQKLSRWEDTREIKNLVGRMSTDYVLKEERSMLARYWSAREDICLGVNEGWFSGRSAVAEYYAGQEERIAAESAMIQAAFPKELGEKSAGEVHGVGMIDYKPVDTGVIEVAGDGQTAKGLWSCLGAHNEVGSAGPVANWTWGYFAADFRREDQGWKIWHLLYVNDVDCICGQSWGKPQQPYPDLPEFADVKAFRYPDYTVARQVREYYRPDRPLTLTPEIPVPYETFADTFSYGIGEEA